MLHTKGFQRSGPRNCTFCVSCYDFLQFCAHTGGSVSVYSFVKSVINIKSYFCSEIKEKLFILNACVLLFTSPDSRILRKFANVNTKPISMNLINYRR